MNINKKLDVSVYGIIIIMILSYTVIGLGGCSKVKESYKCLTVEGRIC